MYQPNTHFIKKVLVASATLAAASLLFNVVPASACSASAGTKSKVAMPLTAGVAAMALAQESASATPNNTSRTQDFTGLWDSKVIYQGQVIFEEFEAFHSDGTEILVANSNPVNENVCLGVWEQTGPSTIKLKHPSWSFDNNGNLLGVVIIYETLTLDPDCDSFHGTSSEDVYDTQGNKIAHYSGFQIKATRIKP